MFVGGVNAEVCVSREDREGEVDLIKVNCRRVSLRMRQ